MGKHNVVCHVFVDIFDICGYFRDTAFTALAIDSHTDGNYFHEAPGVFSKSTLASLSLKPSEVVD